VQVFEKRTDQKYKLSLEQKQNYKMLRCQIVTNPTGGIIKMSKKSYMSLLKEAIAEFDTSDNLEVKGPMLDPILSWQGDGELPVYKDAASILERYYFNEDSDKGVNTLDEGSELQDSYKNDKGSASGEAMKNAKGTGTEQAGTSDSSTVLGSKDEKSKDIAKEDVQLEQDDDDDEGEEEEMEEMEMSDKDVPKKKEYTDESEDLDMENAIIEKLIEEMEDDGEGEEEEMEEAEVMNYTGDGPKNETPKEKKAKDPEEDTHGAGTEQAGTGPDEGEVPPRKDMHDKMVKPKQYTDENSMIEAALAELEAEISEQDEEMDDDEGEEEKDLDVDKKMKEAASAVPGGPSPKKTGEDWEDDERYYSEAFELFKEAIQEQDEEDDDDEGEEEDED